MSAETICEELPDGRRIIGTASHRQPAVEVFEEILPDGRRIVGTHAVRRRSQPAPAPTAETPDAD